MSRAARLWKGVGPLTMGALLFSGVAVRGAEPAPLTQQLTDLGRQALAQHQPAQARTFFKKALEIDPSNADAKRALGRIRLAALQEAQPAAAPAPATEAPAPPAAEAPAAEALPKDELKPQATIEETARINQVVTQQLVADVEQRLQAARDMVNNGQPEAALSALRLAQNVVRSSGEVPDAVRGDLDRRIQAQILSTVRDEERIVQERAETLRLEAQAEQHQRALSMLARNQQTVSTMMVQFDSLMAQGQYNVLYNGGLGDIIATTAPFYDARVLAQQARALVPNDPTPRVGMFVAQTMGFLAQELAYEQVKEFRFMLSMQDVARAAVPFPDTLTIEYPDADRWRYLSEKRIKRYGRAVDLLDRDPKTKSILAKLEEPISMNYPQETPLEDVLKYIKTATTGANDSGIPIYVDPVGLQEAEKTMTSPVTIELEGVPLKTTLRLILKQLGLTYTVKDGLLTITEEESEDQPTEIRVYPVADLAIIPLSLMGGGGMGGGMGGMGGGMMGGMGGSMGGMGGGMGMGGMGMMSVPVSPPDDDTTAGGYSQKKSS